MNEHRTHTPRQSMRRGRGRGALVAIAVLALGTAADTTEASPARRSVEPRSYRAFRGSADTLEHWVEAEITSCIEDAPTSGGSGTADAIEGHLANVHKICTSKVVAPDRD